MEEFHTEEARKYFYLYTFLDTKGNFTTEKSEKLRVRGKFPGIMMPARVFLPRKHFNVYTFLDRTKLYHGSHRVLFLRG